MEAPIILHGSTNIGFPVTIPATISAPAHFSVAHGVLSVKLPINAPTVSPCDPNYPLQHEDRLLLSGRAQFLETASTENAAPTMKTARTDGRVPQIQWERWPT